PWILALEDWLPTESRACCSQRQSLPFCRKKKRRASCRHPRQAWVACCAPHDGTRTGLMRRARAHCCLAGALLSCKMGGDKPVAAGSGWTIGAGRPASAELAIQFARSEARLRAGGRAGSIGSARRALGEQLNPVLTGAANRNN